MRDILDNKKCSFCEKIATRFDINGFHCEKCIDKIKLGSRITIGDGVVGVIAGIRVKDTE